MNEQFNFTHEDLKNDFVLFCHVVWKHLQLPKPTKVQCSIARFMSDSSKRDKVIQGFRGVGKSYIAYAYTVWRLWKNKDLNILVISASASRAYDFSSTCQRIIELLPFLHYLIPDTRETKWSRGEWTVNGANIAGSPSVKSVGILGNITGTRADIIISDDVEIVKTSSTVDQREKLIKSVAEFDAIIKGNEGRGVNSEILYLGTPQSEESLYNHLAKIGFQTRIYPARYPERDKIDDYNGLLDPDIEDELYNDFSIIGSSTDPQRFSDEELTKRELRYGKSGFQLQFMLDTSLSDSERYPLKLSDLIVFNTPSESAPAQIALSKQPNYLIHDLPLLGFNKDRYYSPSFVSDNNYAEFEQTIMAIDPSGKGADETAYAIIKNCLGTLYLVASGGIKGGFDEKNTLLPLAMLAKQFDTHKIIIENNYGGGMFTQLFTPIVHAIHSCSVDEVRHSQQKELRIIDTIEPLINRHKLVVHRSVIEKDYKNSLTDKSFSLFYQLTHIAKIRGCLKHDDRLDALAICITEFIGNLNRDIDSELDRLRDHRMAGWLEKIRQRNDISAKRMMPNKPHGIKKYLTGGNDINNFIDEV